MHRHWYFHELFDETPGDLSEVLKGKTCPGGADLRIWVFVTRVIYICFTHGGVGKIGIGFYTYWSMSAGPPNS